MKVVDANVLLYAVNEDSRHHRAARQWLDTALSGGDVVGFDWVVLLAFVRIATHSSIFANPLTVDSAFEIVDAWLGSPGAQLLSPTPRHAELLQSLVGTVGVGGNLVNDAHLAALAVEHRADVVSFDRDFERFGENGVRRYEP